MPVYPRLIMMPKNPRLKRNHFFTATDPGKNEMLNDCKISLPVFLRNLWHPMVVGDKICEQYLHNDGWQMGQYFHDPADLNGGNWPTQMGEVPVGHSEGFSAEPRANRCH